MRPMGQDKHLGKNPLQEILLRLEKMEARFDNTERNGEVSDVKYDDKRKRWYVKYKEEGHDGPFQTDWRPWKSFSHGAISVSMPPRKGMKATMRSPGGYPEQSYVEAFHYGPDTPSPHDKMDETVIQIVKPKKDKEEKSNDQGGGSSQGTTQSSSSSSSSSSSTGGSEGDQQDDTALRIHASHDGYVLTCGKLGEAKNASASDGDGQSDGDKNTFQMSIQRDAKTITCGKFKAVMGKDGAKMTWGDKVSFELKDGQIETIVDGAKHTLTADNIVAMLGHSKHALSDGLFQVSGGNIKHDDRNIGKGHVHSGVFPGGGKTQQPDP